MTKSNTMSRRNDLSTSRGNTLLVFGSQALSFDQASFDRIRCAVQSDPQHKWMLETVKEVISNWDSLCEELPSLKILPGYDRLVEMCRWFETGKIVEDSPSSNLTLSPLVIMAQLTQYSEHRRTLYGGLEIPDQDETETLGFCLGILSAMVVSCAKNPQQFAEYGSSALRLAILIGAIVDAQDLHEGRGPSQSLATSWKSRDSIADLTEIVQGFSGAYISVSYDENRATVTATQDAVPALKEKLKVSGITASEINLWGRFHSDCHEETFRKLIAFSEKHPSFRLPDASSLILRTSLNRGRNAGQLRGSLHEPALRSILLDHADWYKTFADFSSSFLSEPKSVVYSFGLDRCIPPSVSRSLKAQLVQYHDDPPALSNPTASRQLARADNDIAVIGMSCNVAGAPDLQQFWKILIEGKSQHREVGTNDRFGFETVFRTDPTDPNRKWYGNFIDDFDAFDHKFFKKSPREAASMDPQQRLLLQIAYQAVEQSGYFQGPPTDNSQDKQIGCYIGVCATDYENNVAHHAPNAFSAIGNLRSFIAGKISHYFGWTGPGLTIDTACSASAVAIHQACVAILNGECSAALAGGTNFISSPLWFQNLAAASFLSPTGQCKPFDAKADGYCRGEAIAAVFLKRASQAIEDGDQIFGIIPSTAVYQNQNCTPIFVPNVPSLADLFRTVLKKSGLDKDQISVIEAHGTGTPVGDPAEYDSVRQVFSDRPRNSNPLQLGSVKGLVGHTEGSSGVISLIKILLMIQEGHIPPQASFTSMNPAIHISPSDHMEITTSAIPWQTDFRAALINNYGASGSNASIVVCQAPQLSSVRQLGTVLAPWTGSIKYPFYIPGFDEKSIWAYAVKLRQFIKTQPVSAENINPRNLAFNLARQSNRSLSRALIFTCSSMEDLDQKLGAFVEGDANLKSVVTPAPRPVILCFGGQVSTFVGLDREVFDGIKVLREYLIQCDGICRALGAESIFPGIFERMPIGDPSTLQPMLFALQYSCAMSWMECGLKPVAVVGHSFGELTALCVSGALSLGDALKLVIERSRLIRDSWGEEKGAMMAIEADFEDVQSLLADSSKATNETPATIACYNGGRSFTLAGSVRAIDDVAGVLSSNHKYSSLRSKRLNVTNAFHSTLVEHLKPELEKLGQQLSFTQPDVVPLERATETREAGTLSAVYVAEHMRNPVYFNHAVQRLAKQHPSAIWLEAGSNSTITTMTSRALKAPANSHFQSINITSGGQGLQQLIDATINLWKAGLRVSFWAHSKSQTVEHAPIILPPYQFDKQRHWLEFKVPPKGPTLEAVVAKDNGGDSEALPTTLFTFTGYQNGNEDHARFRINTMIKKYQDIVSGHVIAKTASICPATVEVDLAIEAIMSIKPELTQKSMYPQICNVNNLAPICIDNSRCVFLDFENAGLKEPSWWVFKIFSHDSKAGGAITHVTGEVRFHALDDHQHLLSFSQYERFMSYNRCRRVLESDDAEIISGRSIYKVFSDVVDYGEAYFGLQKLVGIGNESAGKVVKKHSGETWLDAYLGDCFSQVGGIWVNCMASEAPGDMFIANGFEQWTRSPSLVRANRFSEQDVWHVLAQHKRATSGNTYVTDIFIFDSTTGALAEVILGINYAKVSKASMAKLLTRLTPGLSVKGRSEEETTPTWNGNQGPAMHVLSSSTANQPTEPAPTSSVVATNGADGTARNSSGKPRLLSKLKEVLADISGLEPAEIKDDVDLADIGIDSLMGMEMAREIETTFNCTLDTDELMNVTDLPSLLVCLQSALGISPDGDRADGGEFDRTGHASTSSSGVSSSSGSVDTPSSSSKATTVDSSKTSIPINSSVNGSQHDKDDSVLSLPASLILEAFRESKARTDHFIEDHRCSGYLDSVMPEQTVLCVALTVEAFKELGCDLAVTKAGQQMDRIPCSPQHSRLADYLYNMLEETRVIDVDGERITRTAIPLPSNGLTSNEILQDLLRKYPDHSFANQLAHWTGSKLAEVLSGKTDGIKLIFGNEKGRELVSGLYGDSLLNKLSYQQMADFLNRLVTKISSLENHHGTLKILEMGSGTGGTTKWLVPLLAKLGQPVEYTFTDLSPSFVAAARKKYKEYPFMKFAVHDIEKPPQSPELHGSQNIVIASNAVHATRSLPESVGNIHKFLRPDGFLMMLEMTETLYWVDIIFGILEGWWLFGDGRAHAISSETHWEKELHSAGYGHVDWTDGDSPETNIQKIFVALASGPRLDRLPPSSSPRKLSPAPNHEARRAATDEYIHQSVKGFSIPDQPTTVSVASPSGSCILVTGATGSLGCYIVTHLASLSTVHTVVCLNRRSNMDPTTRQIQALESKGIIPDALTLSKLRILETDISKPQLGLSGDQYEDLLNSVTHIIHNAWPMSGKRPTKGFESQFHTMRNLVDLAAGISARQRQHSPGSHDFAESDGNKVVFQLVSSIATVGHYPLSHNNDPHVPEERMTIESVLPNGYGDAKFVCERILDETLHKHPGRFRAMVVRLGQVAGASTGSGYWNHTEHFAFLVKSAQTLRCFPDLDGVMGWTPVNHVAGTLADLAMRVPQGQEVEAYPVYHIDNPVRQPWKDTVAVLAGALGIPRKSKGIVPFKEWIRRVRAFPGRAETDNPAAKLLDFFDQDFVRMSCGGVMLGTERSCEHSSTLRTVGPVSADVARRYVKAWRESGFLR